MLNGKKILLKLFVRNSRSCRAPESERAGCVGGGDPLVARPGPEPAVHVDGLSNNLFSKHTTHQISLKFLSGRYKHFLNILPGKCCPRTPFPWNCTSCPRCRWTQSCLGGKAEKTKFARVQKEREAGSVQFFLFFFWALKDCFALNPPIKNWICFLDGKFFLFTASACLKLDFLPFLGVHSKHCWFSFLVMHEIWVGVFRPLKEIYEFAFFYLGTFRTYSNTFLSALSALFPRLLRTFFSG